MGGRLVACLSCGPISDRYGLDLCLIYLTATVTHNYFIVIILINSCTIYCNIETIINLLSHISEKARWTERYIWTQVEGKANIHPYIHADRQTEGLMD